MTFAGPFSPTTRSYWLALALIALLSALPPRVEARGAAESPKQSRDSAPWVGKTLKGGRCKGGRQGIGPYDYRHRNQFPNALYLVEIAHFTPQIEQLQKGRTNTLPLDDIDYTLRAWPNHHRALNSRLRWFVLYKERGLKLDEASFAECYFQRAINFAPTDPVPYMIFGVLLHHAKKLELAEKVYRRALQLQPNYSEAHYNLGLLLVDMKRFEEAKTQAEAAYKLGYPLPGLRKKLAEAQKAASAPQEATPSRDEAETLQLPQLPQ